ncbi:AraC family transcriptional regulator ligand-binding domain-containing protein, partial [Staphylococcus aureus]
MLLGGAVSRGKDPRALLRQAGIDPAVYGNPAMAIDGRELFRLVRRAQVSLDDSFLGFFAERFRLALELERTLTYLHCETFGESIRV